MEYQKKLAELNDRYNLIKKNFGKDQEEMTEIASEKTPNEPTEQPKAKKRSSASRRTKKKRKNR